MNKVRCDWVGNNHFNIKYHDNEWGNPVHDDKLLFEFLILEGFQAGLSWVTILKKRNAFRQAFDKFDYRKIALYKEDKVTELMNNKDIVRNKRKIESAVINANAFISIKDEFGSFDKYIWQFTNYQTIVNNYTTWKEIPASSKESKKMSKDLKKRGFKFVGETICYAFMQAVGMVNDHTLSCYKRNG